MPTYKVGELTIELRSREDGKHHLSHVHVKYGKKAQVLGLDGVEIVGNIPNKQLNKAKAWVKANKDTLEKEWRKYHGDQKDS